TWLCAKAALHLLSRLRAPCSLATLCTWRDEGVPCWANQKLRARQVVTRADGQGGFKRPWYFCEDDLKAIAAAKAASRTASRAEGGWITGAEAKATFGFGKNLL